MTNRFRWLPFILAIFVGGCGGESEKLQRQEAERVAKEAAKEAKKSTAKQRREETLSTIETLRKKHNSTLSWRTPFNPTRTPKRDDDKTKYREELFSRPLYSFEIQQILETTDETPFLFVGHLNDVIRDGTRCKCYFEVELRGNWFAVELDSTELQTREIIRVSDAVSLDEDEYDWFKRFAIVVREISVAKTANIQHFEITTHIRSYEHGIEGDDVSEVSSGSDRVIHGKLIDFAPVLINDEPVAYGGMSDLFDE